MPQPPDLIRKFYGRSKGKKLSIGKREALTDAALKIELDGAPLNLAVLFGQPYARYELEIGFGSGEHLLHRARLHPNTGFIGVEPFINGFAAALRDAQDEHLPNVRFYNDDAHFLLKALPSDAFNIIHLNYPDPWHKKRHWKRRFVSHESLNAFARLLIPGGEFRCATDIDTYAAWTLMHMQQRNDFKWAAENAADFLTPFPEWITTRYEQKARKEGRSSCYLGFTKLT